MSQHSNIFLIGPMGVGKSTIGRHLGQELGIPFYDSDREIERVTGADIPWIFDVEGEQGFRLREERMIDTLSELDGIVLATGGGAILSEKSRQRLSSRGTVVYLKASTARLHQRTAKDRNRPLLQTGNPRQRIQQLMAVRDPLYRETAHVVIDTTRRSPRGVINDIIQSVKAHRAAVVADTRSPGTPTVKATANPAANPTESPGNENS